MSEGFIASGVIDLLDRPVAFHRVFVTLTGSVTAALMLSQAVYWQRRAGNGAFWWKTQDEWSDEVGLSRREQEGARKVLRELGFWEEKRAGSPARMYYRVNHEKLAAAIFALPGSAQKVEKKHQFAKSATPVCTKPPSKIARNRQSGSHETANLDRTKPPISYTQETTSETTAETTADMFSRTAGAVLAEPRQPARGKPANPSPSAVTPAKPDGVSDAVWRDFLAHRKAKRAPVTQSAIDLIAREAAKAGLSLEEVLQTCCAMGWQGFKAAWVLKDQVPRAGGSPLLKQQAIEDHNRSVAEAWLRRHGQSLNDPEV